MQRQALIVLGALAPVAGACADGPSPPSPPSFLVVVVDDFGVEAVGCYGVATDEPQTTPTMDALAERGVRFENVWVTPICSSTRAVLQTGRHGFRTGVGARVHIGDETDWALQPDEVTLPEVLARGTDGAYASAAFGKWHLGNDSVGGLLAANVAGYEHFSGARTRGPDGYFEWRHVEDGEMRSREGYATSATVDDALAWLGTVEGPFLAYVAFHAVHAPIHEPPAGLHSVDLSHTPRGILERERLWFRAMVEALDTELARLLDGLGERRDDTVVVLVGDNGTKASVAGAPFDHERAKGTMYEGGLRVPLIVAGPGVAAGGVSAALVHGVDLFPTLAELAGADLAASFPELELDGESLVPLLQDPSAPFEREVLYTELFEPNGFGERAFHERAVRDARYKLIDDEVGTRFFDLEVDPWEQHGPLATEDLSPEARAARERLAAELERYASDSARQLERRRRE